METKVVTISTQIALFFETAISRPDTFYNTINSDIGEIIDSMPQTLPLPPEAPAEIPRVIGNSSFGQYNLNVSINRVDLIRNYSPGEDVIHATNDFKRICNNLIISAMQLQKIIRVGVVGNFYISNPCPQKIIGKLYLNEKNQNSDEISLRINKKDKFNNIDINNVVNINQGNVAAPDYNGEAVIIQLDYNTEPKGKPLDQESVISVFKEKSSAYSYKHVMEICGL